jgi:hypothetical protein
MRALAGLLLAIVAALVLTTGDHAVRANGVPQLVKLSYLDGVSNWGPAEGEGVLEFSFAEAYARVDVKHLAPQEGYVYDGWLSGGAGEPFRVGEIHVDAAGIGTLETRLTGLVGYDYDLFVIVPRETGAAAEMLPEQRSIAGRFTVIKDQTSEGANGDSQPILLPNTGERPAGWDSNTRLIATVLAMALVAGGLLLFRRMRTRSVNQ